MKKKKERINQMKMLLMVWKEGVNLKKIHRNNETQRIYLNTIITMIRFWKNKKYKQIKNQNSLTLEGSRIQGIQKINRVKVVKKENINNNQGKIIIILFLKNLCSKKNKQNKISLVLYLKQQSRYLLKKKSIR